MRTVSGLPALAVSLALVAAGCAAGTGSPATLPAGTTPSPHHLLTVGSLEQFDGCDVFLDHVIAEALTLVGPYGLDSQWAVPWLADDVRAAGAETATTMAASDGDFTGTNVQVEGVDEPDIVKTDGSRIVMMSQGELVVVDISGATPIVTGRLSLSGTTVQSLFLSGDTALAFGSGWSQTPLPMGRPEGQDGIAPVPNSPTLQIVEIDVSGEPEIIRTMTVDGAFVSGRLIGDTARLVLTSGPVGFEWSYPKGSGLRAERKAIEENKEIVRNSTEDNWIPYYIVQDGQGRVTDEGLLFDCDRAAAPDEFSGLDMLSIVTIDLSSGLDVVDATGVLARGDTVYSSEEHLYVATQSWQTWRWFETGDPDMQPEGPGTEIHEFDVSDPGRTEYVASGRVDGYLLDQFSMDEHEGLLRVASTMSPKWWAGPDTRSRVTVLWQVGDRLEPIGVVDGLGVTEQIYSVRFLGDTGYVVTFRQTDPLYTIDLSAPRNPRVVGELEITGYSAYLHPLSDGLLMGVGQDATQQGQIQGSQVSVFDVSDPANPVRVDSFALGEGTNSEVEYDHHAFLFDSGLAVIPVQRYWWDDSSDHLMMGAVVLEIGDDGRMHEVGEITHPGGEKAGDWQAQIRRSLISDGAIYTISDAGVMKSDPNSLEQIAWLDL